MKEYNSNYLGLCINNNDPEKRGRVQIFIPHIMPALYDGWNKDGKDIDITCVGPNLTNGLTDEQITKLQQILPWAESASPIVGTSAPGNLITKVGDAIAKVFGYDQSPVSAPNTTNKQDQSALFAKASQIGGISQNEFASNSSSTGKCGVGARSVLGALTNNVSYFSQGIGAGGSSDAGSLTIGGGNNYLSSATTFGGQPLFSPPTSGLSSLPSNPAIGTTVVATGGHTGSGHIQVWTGSGWVSNFSQNPDGGSTVPGTGGILGSSGGVPYDNFTVYTPTQAGAAAMGNTTSSTAMQPPAERVSVSGDQVAGAQTDPTGPIIPADPNNPASGSIDPSVANQVPTGSVTDPVFLQSVKSGMGLSSPTAAANATVAYNTAYQQSISKGATNQQASIVASAIVGNMAQESGFNSSLSHDGGIGYGLLGENQDQLKRMQAYAATKGESVNSGGISTQTQVEALFREPSFIGSSQRSGGFNALLNSNNVSSASDVFAKGYLLPTAATANYQNRENNAFAALGTFSNFTPEQLAQQSAAAAASNLGAQNTSMVMRPNPHGALPTQNLNNTAKGLFTYPAAGAMLWVFFREGNPLYPVYFAASYSNEEWKSAYRQGSNTTGYAPGGENGVFSTGGIMNLGGVGGLSWSNTHSPTDPSKAQQNMMFFGEDGSNMFMGNGYHQIFSKFDRRDQVEGDRWNTTLGYKEDWVQGDHNHVTMGDSHIKIGNCSKEAVDAVTRIQQLIKDSQKHLSDLKK